jgi:hypothetical protein
MFDAAYIQRYCRRHNIYYMVYAIKWHGQILKYGIQHSVYGNQPGERLYTQVGWMPGWNNGILKRSKKTGEAIKLIMTQVEQKYDVAFDKNDVSIEIMDYTHYPFFNPNNRYAEMQNLEEHYKKMFYEQHGHYPIGNPKQEKIRHVPTEFCNLFEFS